MPDRDKPNPTLLSTATLAHYDRNAQAFWEGTKDHDVSQNRQALLDALPEGRALKLLDFGCGPGRDLAFFRSLGHEAVGLDGSENFCAMARAYSGCEVWRQDFLALKLPGESFDGVFANASLFHVPRQELDRVLRQLADALKPQGVLFSSNPRGEGESYSPDGRYANYLELETYADFLRRAGFEILTHYYRPKDRPRDQQPWLAVVAKKRFEQSST